MENFETKPFEENLERISLFLERDQYLLESVDILVQRVRGHLTTHFSEDSFLLVLEELNLFMKNDQQVLELRAEIQNIPDNIHTQETRYVSAKAQMDYDTGVILMSFISTEPLD